MKQEIIVGDLKAALRMHAPKGECYYEVDNKTLNIVVDISGSVSVATKSNKHTSNEHKDIYAIIDACHAEFETMYTRTELLLKIVEKMKNVGLWGSAIAAHLKRMEDDSIRVLLGIAFGAVVFNNKKNSTS